MVSRHRTRQDRLRAGFVVIGSLINHRRMITRLLHGVDSSLPDLFGGWRHNSPHPFVDKALLFCVWYAGGTGPKFGDLDALCCDPMPDG